MVRRAKPDKAMANGKVYRHTPLQPLYAQSVALWKPDVWWRDERSGAAVIVAYIKLAYYLLKAALGRKNYLFCGSDAGGGRAAGIYSLIGSATMNGLDAEVYLRYVLERIVDHPINRVDELLAWNIATELHTGNRLAA